jgi:hypothetical protein
MKTIIILLLASFLFSCQREECTTCIEKYTQVKGNYCGSPKDVKQYKDQLTNTTVIGYQEWSCN